MSDPTTFSESPDREAVWRELANQLGGTFLQPDPTSAYVVQVEIGDWIVTLDTYLVGYEFPVAHTRVRAPFANPGAIRFTMFRTDFFHELS